MNKDFMNISLKIILAFEWTMIFIFFPIQKTSESIFITRAILRVELKEGKSKLEMRMKNRLDQIRFCGWSRRILHFDHIMPSVLSLIIISNTSEENEDAGHFLRDLMDAWS